MSDLNSSAETEHVSKLGLSYDDVLLEPRRSPVDHRGEIDVSTWFTPNIRIDVPIISSCMDTVTGPEMAIAMAELGGIGIVHRFQSVDEQVAAVEAVKAHEPDRTGEFEPTVDDDGRLRATAAVGANDEALDRAERLVEADVDALVVDIAHGHLDKCLDMVSRLAERHPSVDLVAGNVATEAGCRDLAEAGADAIRVGVGVGGVCSTPVVTGVGVPQMTALFDCAPICDELGVTIIADGGIKAAGDIVKAVAAGASSVMIGGLLAGTDPAPGTTITEDGTKYKVLRGMSSREAAESRPNERGTVNRAEDPAEGIRSKVEYAGPLSEVVYELVGGVRSGLSYCGCRRLETLPERARFLRVTDKGRREVEPHVGIDS